MDKNKKNLKNLTELAAILLNEASYSSRLAFSQGEGDNETISDITKSLIERYPHTMFDIGNRLKNEELQLEARKKLHKLEQIHGIYRIGVELGDEEIKRISREKLVEYCPVYAYKIGKENNDGELMDGALKKIIMDCQLEDFESEIKHIFGPKKE